MGARVHLAKNSLLDPICEVKMKTIKGMRTSELVALGLIE